MKTIALLLSVILLCGFGVNSNVRAEDAIQPVFLLCPHTEKLSAWSLYFVVDPKDPSKVLSLNLDQLTKQNSKDSSYEAVVAAAKSTKTPRNNLGKLPAAEFGSGQLKVEKDDALKVSVTPLENNEYRLMVSLRIAADLRFTIGGKEQDKRDVIVFFDKDSKTWKSKVKALKDAEGNAVPDAKGKEITGVGFRVTPTGIYEIAADVVGIDSVKVLER